MTDWLFLDFDNTLMGTEKLAVPSLVRRFNDLYAVQIGRDLTVEEFYAHFKGQGRETLCTNLSAYFNIAVDYPVLYENREALMMQYLQQSGVEMAPNLLETLGTLSGNGIRFAFVSNNPIQRGLAAMRYATNGRGEELARLFGTHYFESGPIQKPDPDIYRRALQQTGADPARVIAVEDSATGIRSALAAGLRTFAYLGFSEDPVTHDRQFREMGVAECFDDWADFPALRG